jgi:hypothetical protein
MSRLRAAQPREKLMLNIDNNIGTLVAAETKGTMKALDDAILTELRLCTTLVEAFEQAKLPVGHSQKLLQSMATGLNHIVAGRGEMAMTVHRLNAIKAGSNLAPTSYNCPGPMPTSALPKLDSEDIGNGVYETAAVD